MKDNAIDVVNTLQNSLETCDHLKRCTGKRFNDVRWHCEFAIIYYFADNRKPYKAAISIKG